MASSEGNGEGGKETRQPKDLKGLLKFCMEHTKSEDPTSQSPFTEMDEERRKWLHEALTTMTENPIDKITAAMELLARGEEGRAEESFDLLLDYCVDIDMAKDFFKLGGLDLGKILLQREDAEVRRQAADLLGTCCQNNPFCQEAALSVGLLPQLLTLVTNDPSGAVQTKTLFALSSLIRNFAPAQDAFHSADGFSVLLRAMQGSTLKVKIKAAFLISALCCDRPDFKDALAAQGMVTQLCGLVSTDDRDFREQVLSALCTCCREHEGATRQLAEADISSWLQQHLATVSDQEESLEEAEYCRELLAMLAPSGKTNDVQR